MPDQQLTIVMYHYIRDFERTRFPRIKGLSIEGFRRQLDYFDDRYNVVTMEAVIAATQDDAELPPDSLLLTFDDGYAEHYDVAFPLLHQRGFQGSFFAPVQPVAEGQLLDVNRIHFLLATVEDAGLLGAAIDNAVAEHQGAFDLQTVAEYRAEWAVPNRWDDAETIYVKRMLQTALPHELRSQLSTELFREFVTDDEATFAAELYLTPDQARTMVSCGMHFGSHGYSHRWLNHVSDDDKRVEIEKSVTFLDSLGMPVADGWTIGYPFGGWDDEVVRICADLGCSTGLTTRVATAIIGSDDPLLLPRFDTNDFPQ